MATGLSWSRMRGSLVRLTSKFGCVVFEERKALQEQDGLVGGSCGVGWRCGWW